MWCIRKSNQLAIIYSLASLSLVAGIILKSDSYYLMIVFGLLIVYLFWQKIRWPLFGLLLIGFCLWRGANAWPDTGAGTVVENGGYGEYKGVVSDEPTIKIDKALIVVKINEVTKDNQRQVVVGKVQIETSRFNFFSPGDIVLAKCKMQPAKNMDGSWQTWLIKDQIIAKCTNAQIKKVASVNNFKFWSLNKLLWVKQKATNAAKQILPEPYSSLLAGILWGARAGLPDNLQQTMKAAGITHIIAISGYNISLITVALGAWLISVGLSKKQMALVVAVVLVAFVIITGASASVVRAAVMGGFVVIIKIVQRKARAVVILPLALTLMGMFNPLAVLYDAGLHLSFLATVGLMYVNPWVEKLLPSKTPAWLKESCVTTLSATLMTGPYCWWQFGQLTLAGLVSNLIVVPLVPWVMITGSLAVSLYFVRPFLALPLATITHALLVLIVWVAQLTSNIPSL